MMKRVVLIGLFFAVLAGTAATAQPPAPPAAPVTAVLVNLTVKPEDRAKVPAVMPQEVRDTVKLYLDGKIQQWYSRADGRGVMFIMNCTTVEEARTIMGGLPLAKAGLAVLDYTPLSPLTPLRALVSDPPARP
jgi:hypothetical protein